MRPPRRARVPRDPVQADAARLEAGVARRRAQRAGEGGAALSSDLERWFARQAARERRIVLLEEGLLGGRLAAYSWYRLRFFFLTYLVESCAQAVTVLVLFDALAWNNFLLVLVATAASTLISQVWWGALEAMRAQVRDLHRAGQPHRIPAAIAGWLTLSVFPAAGFLALGIAWIVWHLAAGTAGPAEAYVATLALRVALDLPTRCYHSGVYATRRVYKPVAATIAPELLGLAVLLALWPVLDVWALVVSSLVLSVTLTGLSLRYTRRVYHFLGFAPLRAAGLATVRPALRGARREALAGGASHAVMALDSLAVLALLHGAGTDSRALVVLFLVMPTVRAGADWARLLYFDLKRLELRLFTDLRRRFERHTALLAVLLGIAFWAVAVAISSVFYGEWIGSLALALLAFFLARSWLARAQVQAFAERAYAAVLATGLLCLGGLAAVGALAHSEPARLASVALVTAAAAVALGRITRVKRGIGEPGRALLTLEWLHRLGHLARPVRVGSARLAAASGPERLDARSREERNRWRLDQLADRAARRLGTAGATAAIGPDHVVWFERDDGAPRISPSWLQDTTGGTVAEILTRECADGEEALLAAGRAELLGRASAHLLTAILPVDVAQARRTFHELLPEGIVYAPQEPVPRFLAELPKQELRAILFDTVAFARDLGLGKRRSRFDVSALCAAGELRLIFITDARAGRRARARWRHRVTALNVRAAIAGARERPAQGRGHIPRPGAAAWRTRASTG